MDRHEYLNITSKYTVMFVDDDEFLLDSLARTYKRYFKDVYSAMDGLEGIEKYKQHRPDIVVTDVTMPKCDGVEMAKTLKELDNNLCIIFTSGHNEEEYIREFEIFGGHWVTKPVNLEVLLELILKLKNEVIH